MSTNKLSNILSSVSQDLLITQNDADLIEFSVKNRINDGEKKIIKGLLNDPEIKFANPSVRSRLLLLLNKKTEKNYVKKCVIKGVTFGGVSGTALSINALVEAGTLAYVGGTYGAILSTGYTALIVAAAIGLISFGYGELTKD